MVVTACSGITIVYPLWTVALRTTHTLRQLLHSRGGSRGPRAHPRPSAADTIRRPIVPELQGTTDRRLVGPIVVRILDITGVAIKAETMFLDTEQGVIAVAVDTEVLEVEETIIGLIIPDRGTLRASRIMGAIGLFMIRASHIFFACIKYTLSVYYYYF